MKITDIQSLEVEQLTTRQAEQAGRSQGRQEAEKPRGDTDVIHLSHESRLMHKAGEVVYQSPDVRPEKVVALQDAVQQGTYQVDSRKVANKIIAELIQEK